MVAWPNVNQPYNASQRKAKLNLSTRYPYQLSLVRVFLLTELLEEKGYICIMNREQELYVLIRDSKVKCYELGTAVGNRLPYSDDAGEIKLLLDEVTYLTERIAELDKIFENKK